MSDEEREKALTRLVEEAKKPPGPELISRIKNQIAAFEAQYGMTTAEMLGRLSSGEIDETLEIEQWLWAQKFSQRFSE